MIHAIYLAFNFAVATYALRLPLQLKKSVVIMCSQKTLPMAMTIVSFLPPEVPAPTAPYRLPLPPTAPTASHRTLPHSTAPYRTFCFLRSRRSRRCLLCLRCLLPSRRLRPTKVRCHPAASAASTSTSPRHHHARLRHAYAPTPRTHWWASPVSSLPRPLLGRYTIVTQVGEPGLISIPCIVSHLVQIFADAFLCAKWAQYSDTDQASNGM